MDSIKHSKKRKFKDANGVKSTEKKSKTFPTKAPKQKKLKRAEPEIATASSDDSEVEDEDVQNDEDFEDAEYMRVCMTMHWHWHGNLIHSYCQSHWQCSGHMQG